MRLNGIEKKLALRASGALIAMLLGIGVCGASPIVYQVNETINLGGVTGTIETDGTIGMLTAAHIIGWDLTLKGPGAPDYEITKNNSVVQLAGSAVSATLDNLFFNYSAGNGSGLLFQQGLFSGLTYWCNSAGYFACFDSESVAPQSFFSPSFQHISRVGNQSIGVSHDVDVVPEPATLTLVGIGLGSLGFRRRRLLSRVRVLLDKRAA